MSPILAIGRMILMNAPNLLQPSIIAASSNSVGIPAKKPLKIHILNGIKKAE